MEDNHHHHHGEEEYTFEEAKELVIASEQEHIDENNNYFNNKFQEYVKNLESLITAEDIEKVTISEDIKNLKEDLTEDELKVLVVYASVKKALNRPGGAELMDIAEYVIEQLQEASLDEPFSTEFIDSIFSFKVVYTVLFSLLDLAENGRYKGEKMSKDYKIGVIDSIVALRKYESSSGFGDTAWDMSYNPAADKHIQP